MNFMMTGAGNLTDSQDPPGFFGFYNLSSEIYSAVFRHFEDILTRYDLSDDKQKFEDEFYFDMI